MNIESLIVEYRAAHLTPAGECPRKIAILGAIEAVGPSRPAVLDFILAIAADSSDYDLARIEAFHILRSAELPAHSRARVAETLAGVLQTEGDELVLQHATSTAGWFADSPSVVSAAKSLLLDSAQDLDVRHNALFVLERAGPSPETAAALQLVGSDPDLGPASQRLLRSWPAA